MLNSAIKLRTRVKNLYKEQFGYTMKIPTSDQIQALYNKNLNVMNNQLLIKEFICSMDIAYIAGSTIKGAMRSAIVHSEGAKRKDIKYEIEKKQPIKVISGGGMATIDKKYFDYSNEQEDPFKIVKISDTIGELTLGVGQANIHTLKIKNGKFDSDIPMYLICALGKLQDENVNTVTGTLNLNDKQLSRIKTQYKALTIQDIINANWDKSQAVINAEKAFYKQANFQMF